MSYTLSGLLNMGITAMQGLDRAVYRPEWDVYHLAQDEKCYVCFAGAVLALEHEPDQTVFGCEQDEPLNIVISVLNSLRQGRVDEAVRFLGNDERAIPDHLFEVEVKNAYFEGWNEADLFLDEMEWLRDELRKEGL